MKTKGLKSLKMHKCLYHVLHYETEIWNFPIFKGSILIIQAFLFLYTTTSLTFQLFLGLLTDGKRKNLKEKSLFFTNTTKKVHIHENLKIQCKFKILETA